MITPAIAALLLVIAAAGAGYAVAHAQGSSRDDCWARATDYSWVAFGCVVVGSFGYFILKVAA
jgi:hypothetical protein